MKLSHPSHQPFLTVSTDAASRPKNVSQRVLIERWKDAPAQQDDAFFARISRVPWKSYKLVPRDVTLVSPRIGNGNRSSGFHSGSADLLEQGDSQTFDLDPPRDVNGDGE